MELFNAIEESIAVVHFGGPILALLSVLVFEVPRYLMSTLAIAMFGWRRERRLDTTVSISVVIPVFNGEGGLASTVLSLRTQSARVQEVIVVDDGSTDGTLGMARVLMDRGLVSQVIHHRQRTGKSAAINHAARFSSGELLAVIDSDTVLEGPDALAMLASAFSESRVAAASGNIRVRNADESLWTAFQGLEYLASITVGRSFLDIFDSVACCSGAFSLFRRNMFLAAGGMSVGPGEDLEITLRLRRLGHDVRFVPAANATTRVPATLARLVRQRLRWDRDAVSIRLFMYGQGARRLSAERLGDTLQRLDFMIFEFYPSVLLPFYIVYVLSLFGGDTLYFLAGLYIYLFGFYALNIAIIVIASGVRLTAFDGLALFGLPVYQGIILRVVRFYAFVTEVFLASSQRDDFVPKRVREALYAHADG
ncbi:glycosyltransferase family 2 protein [Aestuariivirga litoralis]|uniref:Glycosyltransferase family 2 protein n=1 Tax=Aestuariivirga litoralis TaxID=2650924 RepID=A0A2W2B7M7_9HYPH|nr:glycosyltransferase [Aestuariivirga litoralis]PZF76088.1 glycosyltransferase family 2 protein [Aestuariivirga litoralis]